MFTLRNHFKIIIIYLLIFLGILFIFYNNKLIAMGNKYSNNNEISNDEEYAWHLQAELAIQNELTHFKFDSDKKTELLNEKNAITAKINKYNKRKKNNQLLTTRHDQPESSQQNIISTIENNENNSSNDNIQYMNLRKNYSHTPSIDKPESSKKNNYK
ncbi:MAG: SVM family protein [Candidatus Phytoplasma australasiaticum]|nr:SVM family protein [Candidatus Phytoplasma australasiaticum]